MRTAENVHVDYKLGPVSDRVVSSHSGLRSNLSYNLFRYSSFTSLFGLYAMMSGFNYGKNHRNPNRGIA